MAPSRYRVSNSQKVANDFRDLLAQAAAEGRVGAVLTTMRKLLSDLQLLPDEVGESTETLPTTGLMLRRALRVPLLVHFAIDEKERIVYLRQIRLWPSKPA